MKKNDFYRLRYIGKSSPLKLLNGKIYLGRVSQLNWFGVVDETNEEYAYPPEAFEVLERVEVTEEERKRHIAGKRIRRFE